MGRKRVEAKGWAGNAPARERTPAPGTRPVPADLHSVGRRMTVPAYASDESALGEADE